MLNIIIRPAHVTDAKRIAEIHVLSWQKAYRGIMPDSVLDSLSVEERREGWIARLSQPIPPQIFVAEHAGDVVGWIVCGPCRDADGADAAEVMGMYLDPAFYRRGIGRQLWAVAIDALPGRRRRVAVWVLEANTAARQFYEAMGCKRDSSATKRIERHGVILNEIRYWLTSDTYPNV